MLSSTSSTDILHTIVGLNSEQLKNLAISGSQFQKTARRDIAQVVSTLLNPILSFLSQTVNSCEIIKHCAEIGMPSFMKELRMCIVSQIWDLPHA